MTETEPLTQHNSSQTEEASLSMIAGASTAQKLAEDLQDKGLDCNYMHLETEDATGQADLSYKCLKPVLAQAQTMGQQMFIAAHPQENKLSVAIRKTPDGIFQVLSTDQLAVLLVDMITDQASENDFVCIKSVVLPDMLDTLLNKKGFRYKTTLLSSPENIEETVAATASETGVSTVLAITEQGAFYCNRGFAYLLEQLLILQQNMAEAQQSLFGQLLELYYRYGFYKQKTLVVNLSQANQVAHYNRLMDSLRKTKNSQIASYTIREMTDYQRKKYVNMETGKQLALDNQPVNILKIAFTDGITLVLAPAEDKMYIHLSLSGKMMNKEHYNNMNQEFTQKLLKHVEIINQL